MRIAIACALLALPVAGCDVEQTEEGELPQVEDGNLPEYDVDTADVEVGTTEETIEAPEVDISTEEQQVEVPTLDVEPADTTEE